MSEPVSHALLAGYPDLVRVPVQWGDQDAFGHVNNTVFLRWFEIGRISYMTRVSIGHDVTAPSAPILAAVSCSFRRQVVYPDHVIVGTRIVHLGNSSMKMDHAIVSEVQDQLVADGTSTVVYFDYASKASRRIPDRLRQTIAQIERATGRDASTLPHYDG